MPTAKKAAPTSNPPAKKPSTKKTPTKKSTGKKTPAKKNAAKNLTQLFHDGLKDIYWAEKNILEELPSMQENATSPKLKKAIDKHTKETEEHIKRLEKCFEYIGQKPVEKKCDAMTGILAEGKGIIQETKPGAIRDAGIISAGQKVEHYEIATYGTLAAFAKVLGEKKCVHLLTKTLQEEKKCDKKLTKIAEGGLNKKALKK